MISFTRKPTSHFKERSLHYTLYYSPGTASLAIHWMLLELGVPHETVLVDIDAGAQRDPAYLKLNPSGRVPTLIVDGRPYGESTALLMLLAERHPEAGFAPAPSTAARAEWMEMMIYLANTLLPAMRDWFYAQADGAAGDATAIKALARCRIEAAWDKLDKLLSDGRSVFIAEQLSTVDFLATMLMRWSRNMPRPATDWPHVAPYVFRLRARPCFREVSAREGLTEWLNP
jgi:glutathione S-transferase